MLKGKKAVIFDLDGTLIDSLGIWSAVDELLATSLGRPDLAADPVTLARLREDALVRHALEPNPYVGFCADLAAFCGSPLPGEEVHRERYHISRALLKSDVRLKPGAAAFVKTLSERGFKLAVATTTKRANIDIYETVNPHIAPELAFSNVFDAILTRENVSRIKPDPEVYHLALETLGVRADEALVFEDSLPGLRAAHAAGIQTVVVRDPWSEADRHDSSRRRTPMLIAFATHPKSAVLPAPSHPSGEHPALEWIQANGLQTNRRYPSCAFFFPSTAANTAATHSASLPPARRSRLKRRRPLSFSMFSTPSPKP